MGDRKTDAAESLEDRVTLDMDKMEKDMFKFDKPLDGAVSSSVSAAIINAQTLQHQVTQNAVLVNTLAQFMGLASLGRFLLDLQGIDVQTFIEGALTKTAGSAIAAEEVNKAKPAEK